jgi:hypothetical protein
LGYLPRVLLFNAFELGAERWKSSIFEWGIKINCKSILNKALYFMQISFLRPLVNTLWFTPFIKKIFRTNLIKIIFQGFMQS